MVSSHKLYYYNMQQSTPLRKRLDNIWQTPNLSSFFKEYIKRPSLKIKKGNIIFYEGDQPDRLYCVKQGFVKMYHSSNEGRETVIYLYGPGSILGIRALTSQDKCLKHTAEAMTDTEIVTISRGEYLDILAKHPEYIIDLLHIFITRLNHTEKKLEGFIITDTTARVANFLAECTQRFGEKSKLGITLPIPLTHQRIAEFVGSFRETVTGAISKLEKDNVLTINRGNVTILNLKKLQQYANNS